MEEKESRGKEVLRQIDEEMVSLDRKGGIFAIGIGVIFVLAMSFLASPALPILVTGNDGLKGWYGFLLFVFIILAFLSIVFFIAAIYPKKKDEESKRGNVDDYRDILSMNEDELAEKLMEDDDLNGRIRSQAELCSKKAERFRTGAILFIFSLVIFVILAMMAAFCK